MSMSYVWNTVPGGFPRKSAARNGSTTPRNLNRDTDAFAHTRRRDIANLGFGVLHWDTARTLDLGARSSFRRVIEGSEGDDFATALAQYVHDVGQAAGQFTNSMQVQGALLDVF